MQNSTLFLILLGSALNNNETFKLLFLYLEIPQPYWIYPAVTATALAI